MTRAQRALRRLGPLLVALPGVTIPAELRLLVAFNTLMLSTSIVFPPWLWVWAASLRVPWLPVLERQQRLAQSGQRVLRTMLRAASATEAAASGSSTAAKPREAAVPCASTSSLASLASELRLLLPWLPAFDRRDALVVRYCLDVIGRTTAPRDDINALALSCYAAALQRPSPGDAVDGRSLRAWFGDKGIALPSAATWADGGDLGSPNMRAPPSADAADDSRIPLAALSKLGWSWQRGASPVLTTPHGSLHVEPPRGLVWSVRSLQPGWEPPRWMHAAAFSTFLLVSTIVDLVILIALVANAFVTDAAPPTPRRGSEGDTPAAASFTSDFARFMHLNRTVMTGATGVMVVLNVFISALCVASLAYAGARNGKPPHITIGIDVWRLATSDGYVVWALPLATWLVLLNISFIPLMWWALSIPTVATPADGWGLGFPSGRFVPPDVPGEAAAFCAWTVAFWVIVGLAQNMAACSAAFHMAYRGGRGAASTLAPYAERAEAVVAGVHLAASP